MATDATGTPTTKGIPTFDVNLDAPSGLGSNAQMAAIDSLLSDRVQASNETLIANKLLSADTTQSFKIMGDGSLQWGAGGASALDTNLYRAAANVLKTDDELQSTNLISAGFGLAPNSWAYGTYASGDTNPRLVILNTGALQWGSGSAISDTVLYRASADLLKTEDAFSVVRTGSGEVSYYSTVHSAGYHQDLYITGESYSRHHVTAGGDHYWGSGSGAVDTNLYRSAANVLKTDDTFQSATAITLTPPNADLGNAAYDIWAQGKADRYFYINRTGTHAWGDGTASPDTNLYRSAANTLKTDDAFVVASWAAVDGETYIDNAGTGSKMFFGSARDTNLYRSSANILRTDDAFVAPTFFTQEGAGTVADNTSTTQTINFGSRGMFLLNAWLSGANEEVEVSWLVQAGPSNLNSAWFELVRGDYNLGTITLATQNGGAQWAFNASSAFQVKVTFDNTPTGAGTANWAWRATRLA